MVRCAGSSNRETAVGCHGNKPRPPINCQHRLNTGRAIDYPGSTRELPHHAASDTRGVCGLVAETVFARGKTKISLDVRHHGR